MEKRGISEEILKKFGIGYADDRWDSLFGYLTGLGYPAEKMLKLGLISVSKGKYYDKYRNRVMIQNIDASDAAGARIIELIKNGISVYSAHTSFDSAMEGNNTYTARKIGLRNIRRPMNDPDSMPGIIGDLPEEMTLIELCDHGRFRSCYNSSGKLC